MESVQAINKREAEMCCMKKHRTYRPKGLSKEEQKYLDAMFRRELIMTLLTIVIGACILAWIIVTLKEVAGL